MSFRALVEKSPAIEPERNIPAPAHSPAVALRREILCGRNGTKHTRASQMPAAAHRREIPRNRTGTKHIRASQMPAVAHRREIPRGRNGTKHIRAGTLARGGSPPRNPLRQKRKQSHTNNKTMCTHFVTSSWAEREERSRRPRRERNENGRTRTKYFYRGGFLRCVRTVVLTPVEMTLKTSGQTRNTTHIR